LTVKGVEVVKSPPSAGDSQSPKQMVAFCPSTKRLIGGGGELLTVEIDGPRNDNPTLTELRPVRLYDGIRDAFVVTAAETTPGTDLYWKLRAYAVCADPLPGLHIVPAATTSSSSSVQATSASCLGQWVIGTGGRISTTSGGVALQVARPSSLGDIARVQAHEVAAGYAGTWYVTSYAICAPTKPTGYEVVFAGSPERSSQSKKTATATCPAGKQLLSTGAAITNTAPGNVSLQDIAPATVGEYGWATAVENTPTSLNWDLIVATAICAS